MADQADLAQVEQEREVKRALANRQAPERFTGACKNCFEPIERGFFCEDACREDYEKRKRKHQFR